MDRLKAEDYTHGVELWMRQKVAASHLEAAEALLAQWQENIVRAYSLGPEDRLDVRTGKITRKDLTDGEDTESEPRRSEEPPAQ